jgi:hypothetical protein
MTVAITSGWSCSSLEARDGTAAAESGQHRSVRVRVKTDVQLYLKRTVHRRGAAARMTKCSRTSLAREGSDGKRHCDKMYTSYKISVLDIAAAKVTCMLTLVGWPRESTAVQISVDA